MEYHPTRAEEPFEAWRCVLPDGRTARATVVPQGEIVMIVWFINDRFEGGETLADLTTAVRRAGEIRKSLMTPMAPRTGFSQDQSEMKQGGVAQHSVEMLVQAVLPPSLCSTTCFRTKLFLATSDEFTARTAADLCGRRDHLKAHYSFSEAGQGAHVSLLTGRAAAAKQR